MRKCFAPYISIAVLNIIIFAFIPIRAQVPSIDSVWFWEETECNDSNIVHICYILSGDTTNISVRMSADSGETWNVPLITLIGAESDIGMGIPPGTHCFEWIMSDDYAGYEEYEYMLEVAAGNIYLSDSFNTLDSTQYQINGNDGYVAPDSEYFVLTGNMTWRNGRLMTVDSFFCDSISIEFDFKFVPGYCDVADDSTGADGMSLIFSPMLDPPLSLGGSIGIIGCEGWGVEFDTYNNFCGHPNSDINGNHIAVSIDSTACVFVGIDDVPYSLEQVDIPFEMVDNTWHHACVAVEYPWCRILIDGFIYIDSAFSDIPEPFWAHIGLSASTGDCCSEHIIDNFTIQIMGDTIEVADTAFAPLDSRPPDIDIICPDHISIIPGDTVQIDWSVYDLFLCGMPCFISIAWCTGETSATVLDTTFEWIIPPDVVGCHSIRFIAAVRDSFCNRNEDTCYIADSCRAAQIEIICGPCGGYSACADQIVEFEIIDRDGFAIDTMRVFFTIEMYHISGDADTIIVFEPTDFAAFTCAASGCDSIMAIIENIAFENGDSTVIILDSLYNEVNCITIPME